MALRSQFKRSVLFSIGLSLLPVSQAHAGVKEWCEFALFQRPSPFLTKIEKWQREARRNPNWRPSAARYYTRESDRYAVATDPRYWYIPGNVGYDEMSYYFPHFVREYQQSLRLETFPSEEVLKGYRRHGPSFREPGRYASKPAPSRRRESSGGSSNETRRSSSDDSSVTTLPWDYSPSPARGSDDAPFAGKGGTSGGAGASGEWTSDPTPAPSHSSSHSSHSSTSSHSHTPSYSSPSESTSSYSSSDSSSSSSSDSGGGGGGGE